jgi:hypothetical protein
LFNVVQTGAAIGGFGEGVAASRVTILFFWDSTSVGAYPS